MGRYGNSLTRVAKYTTEPKYPGESPYITTEERSSSDGDQRRQRRPEQWPSANCSETVIFADSLS